MGYCIKVWKVDIKIKKVNKEAALTAIKALIGRETVKDTYGMHFYWVLPEDFINATSLEQALEVWRWDPLVNRQTEDITSLHFTGEKFGDEKLLFETLAPFIEKGGEIVFEGEDGEIWKYKFDGEKMQRIKSRIVFEDEE